MGRKKATRSPKSDRPPKAAKGGRGRERTPEPAPEPEVDPQLLAQLLALQERTAAVGRQIRLIGELVSSAMHDATIEAAEVIEKLSASVDADSPQPPPVAARPRRRK